LIALVAFLPVIGCRWVNWDDDTNFLNNPDFRGLGWRQVAWAWKTTLLGVYQPLGWMLYEAEFAAWGLDPRGYHVVSLVLHAANAAVLFALTLALLRRSLPDLFRAHPATVRRSAGLAVALFMVHPLRAETVAWVSSQSYLPSALFAMLAVLAYLRAHDPEHRPRGEMIWSVLAFVLFVVAILFKAVAISLPAVLVILDVYPLKRLGWGHGINDWPGPRARRVWLEKLPYLAIGLVFVAITLWSKPKFEGSLGSRLATASYAVWFYPVKTIVPAGISALYSSCDRVDFSGPIYVACALGVVGFTVATIRLRRRWPGLAAAWASYLVMLAPNSGVVRIISQVAADRYSYVASMGMVVLLAGAFCLWSGRCASTERTRGVVARLGPASAGAALIVALCVLSWYQSVTWLDSEMLWSHALEHGAGDSVLARINLGEALSDQGRHGEALPHFRKAVALRPDLAKAHHNLGLALARGGQPERSIPSFLEAIRLQPAHAQARNNLALALLKLGDLRGAETQLTEALRLRPTYAEAHNNLGMVLLRRDRRDEAIAHIAEALRLRPGYAAASRNLRAARAPAETRASGRPRTEPPASRSSSYRQSSMDRRLQRRGEPGISVPGLDGRQPLVAAGRADGEVGGFSTSERSSSPTGGTLIVMPTAS
jgi:tetratricopeptide (TPR) repeat protein